MASARAFLRRGADVAHSGAGTGTGGAGSAGTARSRATSWYPPTREQEAQAQSRSRASRAASAAAAAADYRNSSSTPAAVPTPAPARGSRMVRSASRHSSGAGVNLDDVASAAYVYPSSAAARSALLSEFDSSSVGGGYPAEKIQIRHDAVPPELAAAATAAYGPGVWVPKPAASHHSSAASVVSCTGVEQAEEGGRRKGANEDSNAELPRRRRPAPRPRARREGAPHPCPCLVQVGC